MFGPSSRVRVYVCREVVDMRKSFRGLSGVVRGIVGKDPLSGHVFCFFNRGRNYIKVLYWDGNGYCIIAKRLVRGTFAQVLRGELSLEELKLVFDAIELESVRRRRCYQYHAAL